MRGGTQEEAGRHHRSRPETLEQAREDRHGGDDADRCDHDHRRQRHRIPDGEECGVSQCLGGHLVREHEARGDGG
jgi:hypothetical protein